MKLLRYQAGGETAYGILAEDESILQLVGSPFGDFEAGPKVADLREVRVLAPVEPSKIIGVGLNYQSHIREMGHAKPESPMLFMKPPSGVIGQGDPIVYPRNGQKVEHEAELVVIIGRPTRHVSEERALEFVLGYTCGNDVSERVIQFAEMKSGAMLIGKGFDTFCPLGPVIATDLDPTNLDVMARLNGEPRQNGNTSDLLFSVAKLVSYLSEVMLLLPGDAIMTGTPAGVGPIAPGDVVEIEISGVGVLRNPVEQER
jgi:2-keto-4-pentenoate hydratase/2-oxohepta-3-ene-1,7-dioic acid hydratase in catechol pathway